jgi:hypothetical protein
MASNQSNVIIKEIIIMAKISTYFSVERCEAFYLKQVAIKRLLVGILLCIFSNQASSINIKK